MRSLVEQTESHVVVRLLLLLLLLFCLGLFGIWSGAACSWSRTTTTATSGGDGGELF